MHQAPLHYIQLSVPGPRQFLMELLWGALHHRKLGVFIDYISREISKRLCFALFYFCCNDGCNVYFADSLYVFAHIVSLGLE